jgi:hypothetical protein
MPRLISLGDITACRGLTTLGLLSPRTVRFSKSHTLARLIPFGELNAARFESGLNFPYSFP